MSLLPDQSRPKKPSNPSELAGFQHKKSLGQNFLRHEIVTEWMVTAADVTASDTVLEIGPGEGALTNKLLETGARVIALETDRRLIPGLSDRFTTEIARGQLTLVVGDARELDPSSLGLVSGRYKVVASIPYYLTSFLLRRLLENTQQPQTLVFLLQKEVVKRITAPSKESLLSLSVKAFGVPKYVRTVGRGHFQPPPKVDSAILAVTDISLKNFSHPVEITHFFELLHLGFGQKRKQLLSILSKQYSRDDLLGIFFELKLAPNIRAEDVTLETWLQLNRELSTRRSNL